MLERNWLALSKRNGEKILKLDFIYHYWKKHTLKKEKN